MLFGTNLNIVELVFGGIPYLVEVIYILVGISTLGILFGSKCKKCKSCGVEDEASVNEVV